MATTSSAKHGQIGRPGPTILEGDLLSARHSAG